MRMHRADDANAIASIVIVLVSQMRNLPGCDMKFAMHLDSQMFAKPCLLDIGGPLARSEQLLHVCPGQV